MMGKDKFLVPTKVINALKGWNSSSFKSSVEFDKRATIALLLMCEASEDLANEKVSDEVGDFILGEYQYLYRNNFIFHSTYNSSHALSNINVGFLKARIGNDSERLKSVPKYIAEFC